jgi:quercetin dioxygenase-like cupin family protein
MSAFYNVLITDQPSEGGCIHEGEDLAIGYRTFAPNDVFPAHRHEHFEEIFVGIRGVLVVHVDGVPLRLTAGDRVVVGRGHVHSLHNDTVEPSDICYLKVPFVAGDTVWVDPAPST